MTRALSASLAALLAASAAYAVELSPWDLWARPAIRDVAVSPSGEWISAVARYESTRGILVQRREAGRPFSAYRSEVSIEGTRWIGDDTLLVAARPTFVQFWQNSADFTLLSDSEMSTKKTEKPGPAPLLIVTAMCLLAALKVLPIMVAALAAAVLMTALRKDLQSNPLKSIDLDVDTGAALGVVGPSGSGKTSLLMVIGGLESATSGTVNVAGQDFSKMTEDELALARGENIGIVFQSFHLVPTMTAFEAAASVASDSVIPPTPELMTLTFTSSFESLVNASRNASVLPCTSDLMRSGTTLLSASAI